MLALVLAFILVGDVVVVGAGVDVGVRYCVGC